MYKLPPKRVEVMNHIEQYVDGITEEYLVPIEKNWQPSDFLPDSRDEDNFLDRIAEIQAGAKELSYDFWVVLIADTLTEEALPTYESWIAALDGVNINSPGGWGNWTRRWTAEENRHGDLLNKYLYLSGKVDMRAFETSLQYLLADGIDIQTNGDPYRTFVYTSFQEIATNISHRRVASLAKAQGNMPLAKINGVIAADEARHAKAYSTFIKRIFEVDPDEMMLAFADMMKKKIVMPAHNLREVGEKAGKAFVHFSEVAQRLGVYTSLDYVDILEGLNKDWDIGNINDLKEEGERARDYLIDLPDRLRRVIGRIKVPDIERQFSWVSA